MSEPTKGLSAVMLALYHGDRDLARQLVDGGAVLSFHDAVAVGENERARAMLAADLLFSINVPWMVSRPSDWRFSSATANWRSF